jgi:hypothetical protein
MLVDYSDSEDEDEHGAVAPAAAAVTAPSLPAAEQPSAAAEGPPAKKSRVEINLQSLLQRNDAALPFEEAGKLPDDFFDPLPSSREEDAGEERPQGARGWAALSSLLPAPKNKPKSGKSVSSLYRNAQPLRRPAAASTVSGGVCGSRSAAAAQAPVPVPVPVPVGASEAGEPDPAPLPSMGDAGAHEAGGALPGASLLPKVRMGMYDDVVAAPSDAAGSSEPQLTYDDAPAGPVLGPAMPPADDEPYANAYGGPPPHIDEGQVVSVSQDDMLKAMGPAKQYDFGIPQPTQDVKIAASFWSRSSGGVEQQYKASSLQKRKHQINSLAADAMARQSEIAARASKGMKSKKETAAKYGW